MKRSMDRYHSYLELEIILYCGYKLELPLHTCHGKKEILFIWKPLLSAAVLYGSEVT